MCLIFIAHRTHPDYPLIVAANRDEFFERPTRSARFWAEHPHMLAGQDLEEQGTWLGITRSGRFAAVTNIRRMPLGEKAPKSRGALTRDFLAGTEGPAHYLEKLLTEKHLYNAFNLLAGDRSGLFYLSSDSETVQPLASGIYGLSNAQLDTPWPKVVEGKATFAELISVSPEPKALVNMLGNANQAEDERLPDTGIGLEMERALSSRFINIPHRGYGTRASTVLMVSDNGGAYFYEQNYQPNGEASDVNEFVFSLD